LRGHLVPAKRARHFRDAINGAAAVPSVNPHNQILAIAIQLGLLGAAVLLAKWGAHYFLFRATNLTAWIGTVVVVENVVSSMSSSHLFDFVHGWLYVLGVGTGRMMFGNGARGTAARAIVDDVDKFSAPSSSPGSRWQCRSITSRALKSLFLEGT
jgi:O-antigen ligase